MDERPPAFRIYLSIAVGFIWLLFIAFWLIFYAATMGLLQNIGVFLASIVVAAILEVLIWVPWAMNQK